MTDESNPLERLADALYKTGTPKAATELGAQHSAPPSVPSSTPSSIFERQEQFGEVMYDNDRAAIARELRPYVQDGLNALSDKTGMPKAELDAIEQDMALFLNDARLEPTARHTLGSQLLHYIGSPATIEQEEEWATESRGALRQKYGQVEGEKLLGKVQQFIASHGRVGKQLRDSGYGSNPALVLALAEKVHEFRVRGK